MSVGLHAVSATKLGLSKKIAKVKLNSDTVRELKLNLDFNFHFSSCVSLPAWIPLQYFILLPRAISQVQIQTLYRNENECHLLML